MTRHDSLHRGLAVALTLAGGLSLALPVMAQGKPTTVEAIAAYEGADRQQILEEEVLRPLGAHETHARGMARLRASHLVAAPYMGIAPGGPEGCVGAVG